MIRDRKKNKASETMMGKNGILYAPDLLTDMRYQLDLWQLRAQKKFSQNFLLDSQVYARIVAACDCGAGDAVLEIGPGLGFLTSKLAATGANVVAVEYDESLRDILSSNLAGMDNVRVEFMDALDVRADQLESWFGGRPYRVAANLPYAITGAFFRKFISDMKKRPTSMVVLVQKEVGERIGAVPGDMNMLALSAQAYGTVEYLETVPRQLFFPAPRVDSAVIKLDFSVAPINFDDAEDEKKFWQLARVGFSAKRKMLANNLESGLHIAKSEAHALLAKAGIDAKARAEDLSLAQWVALAAIRK